MLKKRIHNYYTELEAKIKELDRDEIIKICEYLKLKIKNKNKIFVCGNGGSAAISDHFVTDFNEYLKRKSKRKYIARAISLSNSMSLITAISNDIKYEKIFTEQIENFYDKGDCVIIFSCSGTSKNIIEICKYAKKRKIDVICIVGFNNKKIKKYSKFHISINSKSYGVVEDIFQSIMHAMLEI
tara:strand:- start:41618 stop:42169 length:552 start_codon:yes stop_codon:yes gene_type:complete